MVTNGLLIFLYRVTNGYTIVIIYFFSIPGLFNSIKTNIETIKHGFCIIMSNIVVYFPFFILLFFVSLNLI